MLMSDYRTSILDDTLNEWQHGGDGGGGVDVVCIIQSDNPIKMNDLDYFTYRCAQPLHLAWVSTNQM